MALHNVSVASQNVANVSAAVCSRTLATIVAGVAFGSKFSRKRDGVPDNPAAIEAAQKRSTLARCAATSWLRHPSQRLGAAHCSGVSWANTSVNRRRCRIKGTPTALGSPSRVMIGCSPYRGEICTVALSSAPHRDSTQGCPQHAHTDGIGASAGA
jgi:hypothetical protein